MVQGIRAPRFAFSNLLYSESAACFSRTSSIFADENLAFALEILNANPRSPFDILLRHLSTLPSGTTIPSPSKWPAGSSVTIKIARRKYQLTITVSAQSWRPGKELLRLGATSKGRIR